MAPYDIFYQKKHTPFLEKIFLRYNTNIVTALTALLPPSKPISILELGPGKGYFYRAIKRSHKNIKYSAVDQNKLILKNLSAVSQYKATLPNLPKIDEKFDCIYAAYLIEHLKSGQEVYQLIINCKKYLKKKGIIVLLAPDALDQKFEFYAADYTHQYPVTKKAVAMAFQDAGIKKCTIYECNDCALWLSSQPSMWKIILIISKTIFFLYDYHLVSIILSPLYKKRDYEIDNWLYRLYSFTKVRNLLFVGQND